MNINKPDEIFKKIKKEDFLDVLNTMNAFQNIDIDYLYKEWCMGNKVLLDLQDHWSDRLKAGLEPDYSVYSEPCYLNEAFYCWKEYSRRYLLLLNKFLDTENCPINRNEITSVLDLGCGLGFTTIGLKSIFPNSICYGTNEPNTIQIEFDRLITKNFDDLVILDNNFGINKHIDIIFASEFFEHLLEPIDFLNKLIKQYSPKYIIFANTFSQMAIGHFYTYLINNQKVSRYKVSRIFSKTLRDSGYKRVETNFFNSRPNIYVKEIKNKGGLF